MAEWELVACHLWLGRVDGDGYAVVARWEPRPGCVGRVIHAKWVVRHGPVDDGLGVDVVCGNHACHEIAHLVLRPIGDGPVQPAAGTWTAAKLDAAQVAEIRRRIALGELGNRLAEEFGVSHTTVKNIKLRRTWK